MTASFVIRVGVNPRFLGAIRFGECFVNDRSHGAGNGCDARG